MNAIEIRDLSKSFRGMYAVDHLNMTVPVGAIYGFIGENGSGKSTTEKIICGLLHQTDGSVKIFGKEQTDAEMSEQRWECLLKLQDVSLIIAYGTI